MHLVEFCSGLIANLGNKSRSTLSAWAHERACLPENRNIYVGQGGILIDANGKSRDFFPEETVELECEPRVMKDNDCLTHYFDAHGQPIPYDNQPVPYNNTCMSTEYSLKAVLIILLALATLQRMAQDQAMPLYSLDPNLQDLDMGSSGSSTADTPGVLGGKGILLLYKHTYIASVFQRNAK